MIKLKVEIGEGDDYSNSDIWQNYVAYIKQQCGISETMELRNIALARLHTYNARDIPNTAYIDFDTEEDAMVFKIKFG